MKDHDQSTKKIASNDKLRELIENFPKAKLGEENFQNLGESEPEKGGERRSRRKDNTFTSTAFQRDLRSQQLKLRSGYLALPVLNSILALHGATHTINLALSARSSAAAEKSRVLHEIEPLTSESIQALATIDLHREKVAERRLTNGAIPQLATSEGSFLLPGLTIIVGSTGAGKTTMLNHFRSQMTDGDDNDLFIIGEEDGQPVERTYFSETHLLADALNYALENKRVAFIDSLRYLVFSSRGSLGAGGVNMSLFSQLASFSTICRALGISIVTTLNPMVRDGDSQSVTQMAQLIAASSNVIDIGLGYSGGASPFKKCVLHRRALPEEIAANDAVNGKRVVAPIEVITHAVSGEIAKETTSSITSHNEVISKMNMETAHESELRDPRDQSLLFGPAIAQLSDIGSQWHL